MELDALKRAVLDLSDSKFEQLIYAVTKREHPNARRPMAPEAGADVLVMETPKRCRLVVQVKHYTTGKIAWKKCHESLDAAMAQWSPERYRFAFPFAMSGRQFAKFNQEFGHLHRQVTVEPFDVTDLHDVLLEHEDIARRYFPRLLDPTDELARRLTQQAKQGNEPLGDMTDAIVRGLSLGEFINEADPNFEYDTVLEGPSQRAASYSDPPYAVFHERHGDQGVRLVAWPREEADVGPPGWSFTDDEDGRQARDHVEREIASGREVRVLHGIRISMSPGPVRLREALEKLQHEIASGDWQSSGGVTLTPGEPVEVTLGAGQASSESAMGLSMYGVPPRCGHAHAWVGRGDAMFVYLGLALDESEIAVNVAPELEIGRDASTNLRGIGLLLGILTERAITVSGPLVPDEEVTVTLPAPSDESTVGRLRMLHVLFQAVVSIEEAANTKLAVPAEISRNDAELLVRLGPLLREGKLIGTDFSTTVQVDRSPHLIRELLQSAEQRRITVPLQPSVFGRPLDLGSVEIYAEQKLTLTVGESLGPTLPLQIQTSGTTTLRMIEAPGRRGLGLLWTPRALRTAGWRYRFGGSACSRPSIPRASRTETYARPSRGPRAPKPTRQRANCAVASAVIYAPLSEEPLGGLRRAVDHQVSLHGSRHLLPSVEPGRLSWLTTLGSR